MNFSIGLIQIHCLQNSKNNSTCKVLLGAVEVKVLKIQMNFLRNFD